MAVIKTNDGGTITYHYEKNVGYSIYVPENVTKDTPIFTYTYGGGRVADWGRMYSCDGDYGIYDGLIANGSNSIVIMPDMGWSNNLGEITMDIINSVREEYGITNMNVFGSGYSKGGFGGFDVVAENIRQNPNLDPQVVFFIDDYSSTYYMAENKLGNGKAELFAQNNTVFFTYDPPWKSPDKYKAYIDAGINIVRVEPKNFEHVQINADFFRNGIYDYMTGKSLPKDGYVYKIYNKESGNWEEIEYNKISTVDKLYDFYSIDILQSKTKKLLGLTGYQIKSDGGVVENYLNRIISSVKKSRFLTNSLDQFSSTSDTNVPSQVPFSVRRYFINVAAMLEKITSLTDTIATIDPGYQTIDQQLLSLMGNSNSSSVSSNNTDSNNN